MQLELDHPSLCLGLLQVDGVSVAASPPALLARLSELEERVRADPTLFAESVRGALRDVLRVGGYKPTGRGKPASEYLLAQALGAGLPRICNLVDVCNLVSVRHALPISVLDADLLGPLPAVRFGRADESYVFNASGQSMDVAGLPVVCRGPDREPVGNPVKDAMACKIQPTTQRALYVVYGSKRLPRELLQRALEELRQLLAQHLAVHDVRAQLLD